MNEWKEKLRKISPYIPGEQLKGDDIVKLNANENPYPPSPMAVSAARNFNFNSLSKYPDSCALELKEAIAEYYGVDRDNVFVANGSDEVLAISFQSFFSSGLPILFPDITYSFFPVWCSLFNIPYETCPLDNNFKIKLEDYKRENGGVVIPNPNAPTAIGEDNNFIEKLLLENMDSIVIIDEAYADFGDSSCIKMTSEYPNLLVTRTFSKSRSLAGLRIGYAIGSKTLIDTLEAVKNSYNSYTIDSVSIKVGAASINDRKYFENIISKIKSTRSMTYNRMKELGFSLTDSKTNFLFAARENTDITDYFNYLRSEHILIRHFNLPRINDYVRISIGTDNEMNLFLKCTEKYLDNLKQ